MSAPPRHLASFLLAALAALGCGSAPPADTTPAPSSEDTTDLEALYRARTDSATMRYTAADVDFMTGMIAHHAQALVMAGMAPSHGASATVQTLSARIINSQQDEIATMQDWLRLRDQPVPVVEIEGLDVMLQGVPEHHRHMPGMLTKEQLEQLDAARDEEFDRLFLTYMIQHHQGAVSMVHDLFATDGAGQDEPAFKLASDIQADQNTEIARMQLMLDAMGPTR